MNKKGETQIQCFNNEINKRKINKIKANIKVILQQLLCLSRQRETHFSSKPTATTVNNRVKGDQIVSVCLFYACVIPDTIGRRGTIRCFGKG